MFNIRKTLFDDMSNTEIAAETLGALSFVILAFGIFSLLVLF